MSILVRSLEAAVPFWLILLRSKSPEELAERAGACSAHIAAHGDMLLEKVPNQTAEAFNRTAEGLACLVLLHGSVKFCGVVFKDNFPKAPKEVPQ